MRRFGRRHPRATALGTLSLFAALFAAPTLIYGPVDLAGADGLIALEYLAYALRPQLIFALSIVAIVLGLGWMQQTHLTTRPDPHGMRIAVGFGLFLAFFFLSLAAVVILEGEGDSRISTLIVIVALNLLVGLFEEVLFRGVVFHGLRARHSLAFAIAVSSVLFGAFHAVNLFVGQDLAITVFQIVNAAAIGLFFCAIMLQANSLWPAIFLHALWNCYAMTGQLLIDSVPFDNPPTMPDPGLASYGLPALISALALLLLWRWQVRIKRKIPPPIPGV